MSEDEAVTQGSVKTWQYLVTGVIDKGWTPIAVVGMVRSGKKYIAGIAKPHALPRATLIEVLRQIVLELEREEQGNGQRVS